MGQRDVCDQGWKNTNWELLNRREAVNLQRKECLAHVFLDSVCRLLEALVLSLPLGQGCIPMWPLNFFCMQLNCTAPAASILVRDLILRVLVIWFQNLLRMCNFTPSATLGRGGGMSRGMLVWETRLTFYIFLQCGKAHLKEKIHCWSIGIIHF